MARVALTDYNISRIVMQAGDVVRRSTTLPTYPNQTPTGVADEAYDLLIPASHEKQIEALMPSWAVRKINGMYIALADEGKEFKPLRMRRGTPEAFAIFKNSRLAFSMDGHYSIRNVPGIEEAMWNGSTLTIKPATDGSVIQQPALKAFVDDYAAIHKAHVDRQADYDKVTQELQAFLRQHATLNKAAKVFGPALWQFVPADLKKMHDRETKAEVKGKEETVKVDLDYLVAKAVENSLQLTN